MTANRLTTAVKAAYQHFARYHLGGPLIHCSCPACMHQDTARELETTPLKQIHAGLLAEYTNSAHGYDQADIERQFKYFLPRYFELIAAGDTPGYIGIEPCLTRLDGYRQNWPETEVATVDEYFNAYLDACLKQTELIKWHHGLRLKMDIGAVLAMIILAGGDLDATLQTFEATADPAAALHMASLRAEISWRNSEPCYSNAFLQDHQQAAARIGHWIRQHHITGRIIDAIDLLDDPDYDDVFEMGLT